MSKRCTGCGTVTTPDWATDDPAHAEIVAAAGSPVRIGPPALARAALLTGAHYLPIGRCRDLLEALTGIDVSTGFLAGVRGRAARRLERRFLPHLQALLASAPVPHADETPGRAADPHDLAERGTGPPTRAPRAPGRARAPNPPIP